MIKIDVDCSNFPENVKYNHLSVSEFLKNAHHKKCCYCETYYFEGTHVEHFRPKKDYDWLINDYENLLLACSTCNQHKSSKLPVKEKIAEEPDSVSVCDDKEELIMVNPARSENIDFAELQAATAALTTTGIAHSVKVITGPTMVAWTISEVLARTFQALTALATHHIP